MLTATHLVIIVVIVGNLIKCSRLLAIVDSEMNLSSLENVAQKLHNIVDETEHFAKTNEISAKTNARKKWESKNKEYSNYLKGRTSARSFIRNKATLEDLEKLKELIAEREDSLKE